MAMRKRCATLLALNKWDLTRTELEDARARVAQKLRQRPDALAVSAKTGRGLKRLVARALDLADLAAARIQTSELNRFLSDVQAARQPPAVRGRRLRMYYMTQYGTRPPRFAVQVSDRSRVTRDYAYFLENRLRERYGLQGVPLVIDFRGRQGRRGGKRE
jgi:GTP-binding protein